ncbi:YfiR family protein [Trinickia acidisoli]|uniref:YfiR family protein n=1 Tax=Trinickia acidisoli TaxID=2767482 RepID=UPI001A8E5A39|nr:YfiR family protein [Trinickia acidisoli]
MRAARFLFNRTIVAALAASACARMSAYAQVDLYSLEAAYIYNFTEFTEWPAARDATGTGANALTVCVNPHTPLGTTLAKLDGRTVSGKAWSVEPIPEGAAIGACNVLIVDDAASSAASKASPTHDLPILVVRAADADAGDARSVVALFREGERLRFDIDNTEAARRHLGLSSKLLRLARNVT